MSWVEGLAQAHFLSFELYLLFGFVNASLRLSLAVVLSVSRWLGAWCGFGIGGSAFRGLFCWWVSLALCWGGHLLLFGGSQGGWRRSFQMV